MILITYNLHHSHDNSFEIDCILELHVRVIPF